MPTAREVEVEVILPSNDGNITQPHPDRNRIGNKYKEMRRIVGDVLEIIRSDPHTLVHSKQYSVAVEKKSLPILSRTTTEWLREKSNDIWPKISEAVSQFDVDNVEQTVPEIFEQRGYLYPGRQLEGILLPLDAKEKTTLMFSLALWSTISRHNRFTIMMILQTITVRTYEKSLDPDISWKTLWYIYKCTSCMTWFSFCDSVLRRGADTEGLEVYFSSKMLYIISRFFTHFLASEDDPNPTYQTLLFESGDISNQLLHFFTASLLCSITEEQEAVLLRYNPNQHQEHEVILNNVINEAQLARFFERTTAVKYFDTFICRFADKPTMMESSIIVGLSPKTNNKSSIRKDYNELLRRDSEYDKRVCMNRLVTATKNINEDELVENDIPMTDAPYETNPYVNDEAEEAEDERNNEHGIGQKLDTNDYDFTNSIETTDHNCNIHEDTKHDAEHSEASDAEEDTDSVMHGKAKPLVTTGGESIAFMLEPGGSSKKGQSKNGPPVLKRKPKSGTIMSEALGLSNPSTPKKSTPKKSTPKKSVKSASTPRGGDTSVSRKSRIKNPRSPAPAIDKRAKRSQTSTTSTPPRKRRNQETHIGTPADSTRAKSATKTKTTTKKSSKEPKERIDFI